ncbi:hypothetical protein CsSME_00031935 [Camellia sinensis var. sinensis]
MLSFLLEISNSFKLLFVSLPKLLDWTRGLQIIHIHNIRRKQVPPFLLEISPTGAPGYFPKLLPAKFSCIYWVTHVGFKSPTPTMKMKTNFTTSKSKPHRPTGLTRTHDAGWVLVFMPCVSASNIEFLTR